MGGAFNETGMRSSDTEATALFTSGQAVMTLTGSWAIATIQYLGDGCRHGRPGCDAEGGRATNGDMTIHGSTGWMLFLTTGWKGEAGCGAVLHQKYVEHNLCHDAAGSEGTSRL